MAFTLQLSSLLKAAPGEVWRHASTMNGVNLELSPLVRMTYPGEGDIEQIEVGRVAFRSWLLLFGGIPFDRHALQLAERENGRRFLERSTSWLHARWEHERIIERWNGRSTRLIDRLTVEPRLPLSVALERGIVLHLFQMRHRQLRRKFGEPETEAQPPPAGTDVPLRP